MGLCAVYALSFAGCKNPVEEYDPDKTQIFVNIYNGGFGTAYANFVKTKFENDFPDYQVILDTEHKYEYSDVEFQLSSPVNETDVYITCFANTRGLSAKGYLEDLSDVWNMIPAGDTRTVASKMRDKELYENIFSGLKDDGKYGVPWSDSLVGFIFDYDLFTEKGWLARLENNAENRAALAAEEITFEEAGNYLLDADGKYVLTKGKDGKFGTYDDGQPQTEREWADMLNEVCAEANSKAFIWPGDYSDYVNDIFDAVFAQYDGKSNVNIFNSYNGTYEHGSTSFTVTPQEGYKAFGMEGRKRALQFVCDYMVKDASRIHNTALGVGGNKDAQDKFLLGYNKTKNAPQTAFLIDGSWWENEARSTFKSLESEDRGYGAREYRFMLLPDLENQLSDKTVFSTRQAGAIMMAKETDAAKKAATKNLISYFLSDESCRNFVKTSNGVLPYTFEVSKADYEGFSPFMRNVWDIYNDAENIEIFRPTVEKLASTINFYSEKKPTDWWAKVGEQKFGVPVRGLKELYSHSPDTAVDDYFNGMCEFYRADWARWYEQSQY